MNKYSDPDLILALQITVVDDSRLQMTVNNTSINDCTWSIFGSEPVVKCNFDKKTILWNDISYICECNVKF